MLIKELETSSLSGVFIPSKYRSPVKGLFAGQEKLNKKETLKRKRKHKRDLTEEDFKKIRARKLEKQLHKAKKHKQKKKVKQLNFKVTKANYYKYLNTDRWAKIRKRFFSSDPSHRICFICKSKKNLQAHHKTYERAGKELMTDLVCLCRDCHNATHKFLKSSKHDDVGLWNAADKLKTLIEGKNSLDAFSRYYYQ